METFKLSCTEREKRELILRLTNYVQRGKPGTPERAVADLNALIQLRRRQTGMAYLQKQGGVFRLKRV